MTPRVFISYRTSHGADKATALAREFDALFGDAQVSVTDAIAGCEPVLTLLSLTYLLSQSFIGMSERRQVPLEEQDHAVQQTAGHSHMTVSEWVGKRWGATRLQEARRAVDQNAMS